MSSLKVEFLAKCQSMRNWDPVVQPSTRDRLEMYSLHKQSTSGDAKTDGSKLEGAEKAKVKG